MVQPVSKRLVFPRLELKDDSRRLEHKLVSKPYSVKAVSGAGGEGMIEGYGAVFNDPHPTSSWSLDDDWMDVIAPGTFDRTLAETKARGTLPMMLWMHQRGNVPGAWRSVVEDKSGLMLQGQVSLNAKTPSQVGVYELLKMGAVSGLSIGFQTIKCQLDEETKVRTIQDVELTEVSIVDMPGGPSARVTDVKSHPKNIQFLETVLRDAGLSRKEAKAVLAKGFAALRDAVANDDSDQRDADQDVDLDESLADRIRAVTATILHP